MSDEIIAKRYQRVFNRNKSKDKAGDRRTIVEVDVGADEDDINEGDDNWVKCDKM